MNIGKESEKLENRKTTGELMNSEKVLLMKSLR